MPTLLVDSMLGPTPASFLHSALVTRQSTLDEHHLPSILQLPLILDETPAADRKCHASSLDYCDSCSTLPSGSYDDVCDELHLLSILGETPAAEITCHTSSLNSSLDYCDSCWSLPTGPNDDVCDEHHLLSILGETPAAEFTCHTSSLNSSLDYCDSCSSLPSGSYFAGVERSVDFVYVRASTFHCHYRGLYSTHFASDGDTSYETPTNEGVDSGTFTAVNTMYCDCKTIVQTNVIVDDNFCKSTNRQYIKQLLGPAYIRPQQKYKQLNWKNTSVGALYFHHHSRSCASNSPNSFSFAGSIASLSSESSFLPLQFFHAVIETSVFLLALVIALVCAIIVTLFLLIEHGIQRRRHRNVSVIYRYLVHFNCCLRCFVWKVTSIILGNCLLLFPRNHKNRTLSFTIFDSFQYLVVLHDSKLLLADSTDRVISWVISRETLLVEKP